MANYLINHKDGVTLLYLLHTSEHNSTYQNPTDQNVI